MRVRLKKATPEDAAEIASFRASVARKLTSQFGKGFWSSTGTEKGVLFAMRTASVFIAREKTALIASVTLSTKKPWAIDKKCFQACEAPLYLTSMAVAPDRQGQGIGRLCIEEVRQIAFRWPSDALRLDAFDAEAGAGEFYRKCGFEEVGRASYKNTPLIYYEMLL